ncbi:MAG: PucR family transcriptional regulator [Lachnospiraceae bacterium]|nr:PucR family transcriptional regulator [Lachnospiraceae bacterium]
MAVTCSDIMELKTCGRLRLIGGASGLDRVVTWPFIKNMDTITEWIHGGELVFVIGAREDISERGLLALMEEADRNRIAGVVLLIGEDYIKTVPRSVIRFANDHTIPLFKMPFRLKLIDITQEISRYILEDKIKNREQGSKEEQSVLEMLLNNRTREDVLSYCFRKIQPLVEADKITRSEYVRTLKCYLACKNDLLHASEAMYIHRNTMINRMRKINALLHTDVNDAEVRNEYWNVFKILEYYGTVTL